MNVSWETPSSAEWVSASSGLDACEQLAAVESKSVRTRGHTNEVGCGQRQVKNGSGGLAWRCAGVDRDVHRR